MNALSMIFAAVLVGSSGNKAPEPQYVVVTTKPIARGAAIDESNTQMILANESLSRSKLKRALTWDDQLSIRARRTLQVGALISLGDIEAIPDVMAGDRVLVTVIRGSIKVSLTGTAKEDGLAGETIWVENPESKKRLRARVEGPGQVVLRNAGGRR